MGLQKGMSMNLFQNAILKYHSQARPQYRRMAPTPKEDDMDRVTETAIQNLERDIETRKYKIRMYERRNTEAEKEIERLKSGVKYWADESTRPKGSPPG